MAISVCMGELAMEQITSKITGQVLHIIHRLDEFVSDRQEVIASDNHLQCATLKLRKGKEFRPHKHVFKPGPQEIIAQESWVVISGMVECVFYDLDDSFLCSRMLSPGDASFTLAGGHTYKILRDAMVYEYKSGPYTGIENDKVFLKCK